MCHTTDAGSFRVIGTPLHPPGQPPPDPKAVTHSLITPEHIYDCIASPHPSDIAQILTTLLETTNVVTCLTTINTLKTTRGLALADILTALGEELVRLDVPAQTRVLWLEGLADIEARLSGGGGEVVQTGGVVGVVRAGVEVMGNR